MKAIEVPRPLDRVLVVWCQQLCLDDPRGRHDGRGHRDERGRRERSFAHLVDAVGCLCPATRVITPGICAFPSRAAARYFGGEHELARNVQEAIRSVEDPETGHSVTAGIGVADGMLAAMLAARLALAVGEERSPAAEEPLVVPPGGTPELLAGWPVEEMGDPEVWGLLRQLGIRTLGDLAALPEEQVRARFGAGVSAWQAAARGLRFDLPPGYLPTPGTSRTGRAGRERAGRERAGQEQAGAGSGGARQPDFWGGEDGSTARMAQAAAAVRELLGPDAVSVGRTSGGRSPGERGHLVPWTGPIPPPMPAPETLPWPGSIMKPSPALVPEHPMPAELCTGDGRQVGVSARGLLDAVPELLSLRGVPRSLPRDTGSTWGRGSTWEKVAGWAGPWPADERWWSPARRRRARLQVLTAGGDAYLLSVERGRWTWEATYD